MICACPPEHTVCSGVGGDTLEVKGHVLVVKELPDYANALVV